MRISQGHLDALFIGTQKEPDGKFTRARRLFGMSSDLRNPAIELRNHLRGFSPETAVRGGPILALSLTNEISASSATLMAKQMGLGAQSPVGAPADFTPNVATWLNANDSKAANSHLQRLTIAARLAFEQNKDPIRGPNFTQEIEQRNQEFKQKMEHTAATIAVDLTRRLKNDPIGQAAEYTNQVFQEAAIHESQLATLKNQVGKAKDRYQAASASLNEDLHNTCKESIATLKKEIDQQATVDKKGQLYWAIINKIQSRISNEASILSDPDLMPPDASWGAQPDTIADDLDTILKVDGQNAIENLVKTLPKLAAQRQPHETYEDGAYDQAINELNEACQAAKPHPEIFKALSGEFKAAEKEHQNLMLAIHKEQGTGDLYTSVHAPLNALRQVSSTATAELTELSTDTIGIVAQTKAINQLLGELGKHEDILQSRPDMTHCYKKDIDRTISELKSRQRELVRLVQITLGSKVNRLQHNPYETQAFMAELDALSRALRLSPQEAPQLRGHSNLTTTDKGLASLQDETTTQHWIKGKNGTYSAKQLTCTIKDKKTGKEIEHIVIFSKAELLELLNKFKDEHMIDPVVRESPNKITITWPGKSIYGGGQGQNAKDTWMEHLKSAYKAKNESKPTTTATVEAASPQAADAIAAAPMLRGGP
jgi:hypothetical protein